MNNPSDMPIIYGFPVYEQEQDFFPTHTSAEYVLPSASVSYPYTLDGAEFCENVDASIVELMASNEFYEVFQILAEEEEVYQNAVEVAVTASPVAMPVASSLQHSEVCSAYPFTVTEAQYYAPYPYATEEEKKEIEFLPDDCVHAVPPLMCELETEKVESFESAFGAPATAIPEDSFETKSAISADFTTEWKFKRRQEAIARWRLKKLRRKNASEGTGGSKINVDVRPSSLNARQQAASKRTRVNGKFKRNQIKWVTASDVF